MPGCHVQPDQQWNLIFGYNAGYYELFTDTSAPAGTVLKYGTVVPAGQAWVVQAIAGCNVNRQANVQLDVYDGASYVILADVLTPAANRWGTWTGSFVMGPGAKFCVIFLGTTLNDDLYWAAGGYKMKLTQ